MNVVNIIQVKEVKKPERAAWEMSDKGFESLNKKFPGKYQQVGAPSNPPVVESIITKKKVEIKPNKANK